MTVLDTVLAVASDMDGTLLHTDHSINDFTRDVLNALIEQRGVQFICATARHHVDMLATKSRCAIPGYLVTSNGARVHDKNGHLIMQRDMCAVVAEKLIYLYLHDPDVCISFYQGDRWLLSRYNVELTSYYEDMEGALTHEIFDPTTHADYHNVFNVYFLANNSAKAVAIHAHITELCGGEVHMMLSSRSVEVMGRGVFKASTIARLLKERIRAPDDESSEEELMRRCVVFGDGQNDYEMLMMSGKGFIMQNAHARLLARLPSPLPPHIERIGVCTDHAVAHKIADMFDLHVTSDSA